MRQAVLRWIKNEAKQGDSLTIFAESFRVRSRENLIGRQSGFCRHWGGLHTFRVMNATVEKDNGTRQTAVLQQAGGDRRSKVLECHPGLTAGAAVAHNAVAIKLGDSTIATTMSEGTPTETGMTAGKPLKVSVAQVLIYELRVRDAMTRPPVTAGPGDSLRTIQHLMKSHRISGVPILQDGVPVGLVSIEDIINALDQGTSTNRRRGG
jgi:signal-transduction protein with cAMP-binding, CBS, and nucleotidyltransferase domain